MRTFQFETFPSHIELWDICVTKILFPQVDGESVFERSLAELLQTKRVRRVLDTSAGAGFPSQYLRQKGYLVDCLDNNNNAIELFMRKANQIDVDNTIHQMNFQDVGFCFPEKEYDFLLCKGTIWFADNGYLIAERNYEPSKEGAKNAIIKTLAGFSSVLKDDGCMYLDLYADTEKSHSEKVAEVLVGEKSYDLVFDILYQGELRRAQMLLVDEQGSSYGEPCFSTKLYARDLEACMDAAGLVCEKVMLQGETYFQSWLCYKK